MKCPRGVDMDLLEVNKYGGLVDVCPSCGGIWLDKGDLSIIKEAIRRAENSLDERVSTLADEELSLGDFVLAGGELFALVLLEGVDRERNTKLLR